jgi:LacI family transcriptional regulator
MPSAKDKTPGSCAAADKNVTIHEIAQTAGVSIASVSRALNGKPGISDKLRARILQISQDIQYQPSAAARQLIGGKSAVVGISMERHSFELRPYYNLLYRNLTLALHKQGMIPVTISYEDSATLHLKAGSAILLGKEPGDVRPQILSEQNIPYIRIDQPGPGFSIMTDGVGGIHQATRYLIEQGRQRIDFMGEEITTDIEPLFRVNGYFHALQEANLPTGHVMGVPFSHNPILAAYRYLRRVLEQGPLQMDALVCETDEHALGCIAAFEDHGIRVPEDVAVTGFDDLPMLAENITTLHQDIPQLARAAVELLGEAISGAEPHEIVLPVELICRQSA